MCISPDTFRRHLKTHYFLQQAFLLAPQIRLLLTIVHVYKLYLLIYLLTYLLTYKVFFSYSHTDNQLDQFSHNASKLYTDTTHR